MASSFCNRFSILLSAPDDILNCKATVRKECEYLTSSPLLLRFTLKKYYFLLGQWAMAVGLDRLRAALWNRLRLVVSTIKDKNNPQLCGVTPQTSLLIYALFVFSPMRSNFPFHAQQERSCIFDGAIKFWFWGDSATGRFLIPLPSYFSALAVLAPKF